MWYGGFLELKKRKKKEGKGKWRTFSQRGYNCHFLFNIFSPALQTISSFHFYWYLAISAWPWLFRVYVNRYASMLNPFSCVRLFGNPMDCSPPGSYVHGIFLGRILEWVAMPSSRSSSWHRDWIHVSHISCIGSWVLYHWHHLGSPMNVCDDKEPRKLVFCLSILYLYIINVGVF